MADVKWIKIVTDIFDDEKIKLIESLPNSDTIIVIWFKLLCVAGKSNSDGFLMMNDSISYNEEMLTTIFNRPITSVRLALKTFVDFGMIEILDQSYKVTNWEKHQNIDGLDKIREQTRVRVARHRAKALENKKSNVTCNDTVTQSNAIDIELDKNKNKNRKENKIPYQQIADDYHFICQSFPKLRTITEKRKKSMKSMLNKYSLDELTELFEKAESSDFLSGRDGRWQSCNFDWLMNSNNAIKVLEGNYENKAKSKQASSDNPFLDLAREEGVL